MYGLATALWQAAAISPQPRLEASTSGTAVLAAIDNAVAIAAALEAALEAQLQSLADAFARNGSGCELGTFCSCMHGVCLSTQSRGDRLKDNTWACPSGSASAVVDELLNTFARRSIGSSRHACLLCAKCNVSITLS